MQLNQTKVIIEEKTIFNSKGVIFHNANACILIKVHHISILSCKVKCP